MKHVLVAAFLVSALVVPAAAKTHKDTYNMPCSVVWTAVNDTLNNSGKYDVIGVDSNKMTASYSIGGSLSGRRINALSLSPQGTGCVVQIQSAFSVGINSDYSDFKKRLDQSLLKQPYPQPTPDATPSQPASAQNAPAPQAAAPTITIGSSRQQVIDALGDPTTKAVDGSKEILFFSSAKMKITLVDGKVSSID